MTQVLTCLTPRYVVQVADRRLTELATGKPVEDEACKAVLFAGRAVVGYTGLANVKPPPRGQTDLWLVDQLGLPDIENSLEPLRQSATQTFKLLTHLGPIAKRHSFVVAGWRGEGIDAAPYCATVSNAERNDGSWSGSASAEFGTTEHWLGDREIVLRASGQPLDREVRRNLLRSVRQSGAQERPVDELVGGLVGALRLVAARNPLVGSGALASVLPREAIGTEGFGMPDGLTIGPGEQPTTRAYYFPPTSRTGTLYAPHYVGSNMRVSDVQIFDRALTPEEMKARYEAGLRKRQ